MNGQPGKLPTSQQRFCPASSTAHLPARKVQFPVGHSMGVAYLRAPLRPGSVARRSRRWWSGEWYSAGPALGCLSIPAGHELKLAIRACEDPDDIARLAPRDVQALCLGGNASAAILQRASHLEALEHLELWAAPVGDDCMGSVAGLPGLKRLDLWGTRVTSVGLAELVATPGLRALSGPGRQVDDRAMAGLAAIRGLKELDLSGSSVTDAGLDELSASTSISRLVLWGTRVTDAGLAALGRFTSLSELDLGATAVTDAGLAYLKEGHLRRVSLRDCCLVSPAAIRALSHSLPDCRVEPQRLAYCSGWAPPSRRGSR